MEPIHDLVELPVPEGFLPFAENADQLPVTAHFMGWVRATPDHAALVDGAKRFSYRELGREVIRIEQFLLMTLGEKEEPVGLLFGKEAAGIAGILAVMKAGKFYVGLDPASPPQYLRTICEDLDLKMILTGSRYLDVAASIAGSDARIVNVEDIEEREARFHREALVSLETMAGVYYTSGSTGKPKGVLLDHRAMSNRVFSNCNALKYNPSDRICLPFPVGVGWQPNIMFGALAAGGTLFLYDYDGKPIVEVADWLVVNRITASPFPLAFLRQFLFGLPEGYGSKFPDLRLIITGGEAMQRNEMKLCQERFSPGSFIVNTFASTEAGALARTFYTTESDLPEARLTFGTVAPGVEFLILDEEGRLATNDAAGEIVIRGDGIMRGYWRRDSLNAKMFMADLGNGQRKLLLTGDMGRLNEAGRLEFTGRKDDMVKIRGYRIQLDAIDLQLRKVEGIRESITVVYQPPKGDKRLAAYLVPDGPEKPSVSRLREALSKQLPDYMTPSAFIWMEFLPLTSTGKINRKELPAPSNARPDLAAPYVAPRTETERQLAALWESLLGVEGVGVDDNFFELGGDSLLALQMTLEAEKILARRAPQSFFAKPTIASLGFLREQAVVDSEGDQFALSSRRRDGQVQTTGRKRAGTNVLQKMAVRSYSLLDVDRMVDRLVGRYMVSRPYLEARDWAVKWIHNPLARGMIYPRRYQLFSRFIASLDDCSARPADAFPMNILTNLNFTLARYLGDDWRNIRNDLDAIRGSRFPYWRSLSDWIASGSADPQDERYAIIGLEHLAQASHSGRGVILLTFHGASTPAWSLLLAHRLGLDGIPTISHRIPARQSEFGDQTDELPFQIASSLNAEIAMHAQKRLLEGQVVNIVGDASDTHGRRYEAVMGGRVYQIKAGFAELALNTGAVVIPHFGSFLPNGDAQLNLGAPLEAGHGDRASQVERLISAYAEFITRVWTTQPEIAWWTRIRRHLSQPPASTA